jgi:hypothetical protein
MKKLVDDWVLLAKKDIKNALLIIEYGMPSMEQAKNFLEFAKEIEEKIQKELNKDE